MKCLIGPNFEPNFQLGLLFNNFFFLRLFFFSIVVLQKYNMFMAQIGCAAIGVLAFSILGPGWLARSFALAASIAFMTYTRSPHPPGKN